MKKVKTKKNQLESNQTRNRKENEELPESSVAVEFHTQRHEKKRSRGKDGLAQPQREASTCPH